MSSDKDHWAVVFSNGQIDAIGTFSRMTYLDVLETRCRLENKPITLLKNGRVIHDGDFDAVLERYAQESSRLRSKVTQELRELFPEPTR